MKYFRLVKWSFLIFVIIILIVVTGFLSTKIQWVSSSYTDISDIRGDFLTRYVNDILKLRKVENRYIYLIDGVGFVHKNSEAAEYLDFSSETNDTGWVEIVLTGGIIGSLLFVLLFFSHLIYFLKLYSTTKKSNILTLIGIWIMSGILLFSSNLLFWDFGFVPIALFSFAILAKVYNINWDE